MLIVSGFKRPYPLCEAGFGNPGEKRGYPVFLLTCVNRNSIPTNDIFGEHIFKKSKEDVACIVTIWNDIEFDLCQTIG
jgi:hypothetical protein